MLAFSEYLYNEWITPKGYRYKKKELFDVYVDSEGNESQGLKTDHLLKFARKHFACEELNVVPLENEGGEGS